jgi:hypothetical protein
MLGVAGQADAVVGGVAFLGENGHPPNALAVPGPQGLDETVCDHPVPDHDDTFLRAHGRQR